MTTTIEQVLENINNAIANGMTVRIASSWEYTDVTAKTVARFQKAGYELFKIANNSLYMRRGKSWEIIQSGAGGNTVKITAY